MEESLELLDEKFKLTMINMLRNPTEMADSIEENVLCKQRIGNIKKESKGNTRNKKQYNKTLIASNEIISRQDSVEKRISELKDTSLETCKTEKQRKNETQYPRTTGQFKMLIYM